LNREVGDVDVLKAPRLSVFANDQGVNLMRTVCIGAQRDRNTFFIFLMARKTLCCQRSVGFQPAQEL
jgi:hypothetical protein